MSNQRINMRNISNNKYYNKTIACCCYTVLMCKQLNKNSAVIIISNKYKSPTNE